MQIKKLFSYFDKLQKECGCKDLNSIYGAGKIRNPKIVFVFMNPTGKNIASNKNWKGLKAPWLGTKNVWKLFYKLKYLDKELFYKIQEKKQLIGMWLLQKRFIEISVKIQFILQIYQKQHN